MSNGEVKRMLDPRKSYKYTMKEELFCIAFTGKNLGNATQAAISAGYSKKSSREIASENMTKPHIQNLIEYLSHNRRKALTSEDIYENWYNIVNDDKVHTSIKARVLNDNARENGMYIDRQEINVSSIDICYYYRLLCFPSTEAKMHTLCSCKGFVIFCSVLIWKL